MSTNITLTGRLTKDRSFGRPSPASCSANFDLAHDFGEPAGSGIKHVAALFFNALDLGVHSKK